MQATESLAYWINRTSRGLQRAMEAELAPFGFGPSHLLLLGALRERQVLTQAELARIVGVEQPTMAKVLARLERVGLVQTAAHPSDGRAQQVSLTRKAVRVFPRGLEALAGLEQSLFADLSGPRRALLRSLLQQVVGKLEVHQERRDAECAARKAPRRQRS